MRMELFLSLALLAAPTAGYGQAIQHSGPSRALDETEVAHPFPGRDPVGLAEPPPSVASFDQAPWEVQGGVCDDPAVSTVLERAVPSPALLGALCSLGRARANGGSAVAGTVFGLGSARGGGWAAGLEYNLRYDPGSPTETSRTTLRVRAGVSPARGLAVDLRVRF